MEAVNIYTMTVQVFRTGQLGKKYFYLIGWGKGLHRAREHRESTFLSFARPRSLVTK